MFRGCTPGNATGKDQTGNRLPGKTQNVGTIGFSLIA